MKRTVGLWVDHSKAVIVAVTDEGEPTTLIVSRVETHPGRSAGVRSSTPYTSSHVPADDRKQTQLTEHLATYYDAVIAGMRGAESVLIFGPGEAKVELKQRLEKDHQGMHIVGVEPADKMTDRQVAAKVRKHFAC